MADACTRHKHSQHLGNQEPSRSLFGLQTPVLVGHGDLERENEAIQLAGHAMCTRSFCLASGKQLQGEQCLKATWTAGASEKGLQEHHACAQRSRPQA